MKTIIVYTSRYGCTEKAAHLLKSRMGGEVEVVNLLKLKDPSLSDFDTVILGGSIYYGRIQKEMTAFLNKAAPQLAEKRLGLFICAGMNGEQVNQELQTAFPEELRQKALAVEAFGDELDHKKLSLMDKFIIRMVKGKGHSSSGLSTETINRFSNAMKNVT